MHRAKGDRFLRASDRPVCDNAKFEAEIQYRNVYFFRKTRFALVIKINKIS